MLKFMRLAAKNEVTIVAIAAKLCGNNPDIFLTLNQIRLIAVNVCPYFVRTRLNDSAVLDTFEFGGGHPRDILFSSQRLAKI